MLFTIGYQGRALEEVIPRAQLLAKYRAHLNASRGVASEVAELARGHRAALVCYEAAAADCHRSILAPREMGNVFLDFVPPRNRFARLPITPA